MFKNGIEYFNYVKKYLYENINKITDFIGKIYLNDVVDEEYYNSHFKPIPEQS